jgi:hypothetical protein
VPGTVEVEGDVIRFVPADDLALLGSYTAVVTPAVTDLAGNPLAGEHRFQLLVRDGAWDPTGTPIENDDGEARTPDVAMDPRGNVTVVWSQYGPPFNIWANRYDAGTGLRETAQLIEHDDAGDALAPRVAIDAAGNAIAVWQQSDGTHTHVWASRHGGTCWDAPVRLDTSDTADAQAPRIAMNAGGAAIVVWRHAEGTTRQAWINRFDVGSGWSGAEPVQIFGQPASIIVADDPVVGIDAQGNAIVLVLDRQFNLRAVPYLAASGWGEAETPIRGPVDGVDLAMAPTGYALALWHFPQPSRIHAWSRQPDGESRIDLLMLAEESEFGQLRTGDVAVNPAGNGIALWIQDSPGPRQVWAGVCTRLQPRHGAPRRGCSRPTPCGHEARRWGWIHAATPMPSGSSPTETPIRR